MSKIRILADRVANQIAAGEVVERPASVVKELLENSLDANAKKIEVEFRDGGKSYIRVEDDGQGMNQDQALLSLERHATSKIREAKDLNQVTTFGFRGEALPSIASVSRFTMRTRTKNCEEGSELFINGGKLVHVKDCGMPVGTRIEVSHLFNSVPGRRKFLKTVVTESSHLMHLSKLYALAHPEINFSLLEGGRVIFKSPACDNLADRVMEIFGKGFAASLAPVEFQNEKMKLRGLAGIPGQSRSTRKEMIFFVNHRPVESKTLSYATIEAFHTFVPKGRFPPAILFLELDPSLVDVNVHPSKKEIRFREEFKVRNFLLSGLLDRNQKLGNEFKPITPPADLYEFDNVSQKMVPQIDPAALHLYGISKEESVTKNIQVESDLFKSGEPNEFPKEAEAVDYSKGQEELITPELVGVRTDALASWRLIDRPKGDLALFSTVDGLVVFHGRAAYERVHFEKLEDALKLDGNSVSQSLLIPETFEADEVEVTIINREFDKLKTIGFEIEEFGRNYFRLSGCPEWLDPTEGLNFIKDFLAVSRERGKNLKAIDVFRDVMIDKSSIKTFESGGFSDNEIIHLAKDLLSCRNPFTCPKGNPTYFEIPTRDFEARFRRKV